MLLELYLANIMSKQVSVSSLCIASKAPMSTALRWIGALGQNRFIDRTSDPLDARRSFISLSELGLARMDGYFENLAWDSTPRAH